MLPESKLIKFIDEKNDFSIHFLEAQKLISDLAIIHSVKGSGFSYFRHSILAAQPLIAFLKPAEAMGVFIDSEVPYFRLKIEMTYSGKMRTLLFPENFNEFPSNLTGKCRLTKQYSNKPPYTSVIDLNGVSYDDIINKILKDSYQVTAKIIVSETSDQSILLMKLPPRKVDSHYETKNLSPEEYWEKHSLSISDFLKKDSIDREEIIKFMHNELDASLLGEKEVIFECTCNYKRVFESILALTRGGSIDHIFYEGEESIETKCDYCKVYYQVTREDILKKI